MLVFLVYFLLVTHRSGWKCRWNNTLVLFCNGAGGVSDSVLGVLMMVSLSFL